MATRTSIVSNIPRPARLAACLAAALGLTLSAAHADDIQSAQRPMRPNGAAPAVHLPLYLRESAHARANTPNLPATPHVVTTCADDGSAGSLRAVIGAPGTQSGDLVDLSQLSCSTITLAQGQGAIQVVQDSLYLKGPSPDSASPPLTIDANNNSAVLYHFGVGTGTLTISNLTISNGYYIGLNLPTGGCIYSTGSVYLANSVVSHCTLESSSNSVAAHGAGVYVRDNLTLVNSTITDSHVFAVNGASTDGGGAFVGGYFAAYYSTISNNTANALGGGIGLAGGVMANGGVDIQTSTISGNSAQYAGALDFVGANYTATIIDSTVSGNIGSSGVGGIYTRAPLSLTSSTVAFNRSLFDNQGYSEGVSSRGASLTLNSSIIADNAGPNGPSDLGGPLGTTVAGANNLITSSTLNLPFGTIFSCPQLEPLADNGGSTRTHRLKPTSPAIDAGHAGILTTDQRGVPRVAGIAADIGSVEGQPGEPPDEHIFVSGFDGVCDQ